MTLPRPQGAPPAARATRALAAAVILLLPLAALADEWSARPRISSRLVYDDNPRLWRDHTNDALGVVTEAAVDLGWSDGASQLTFTPRLRHNEYGSDHPELDSLDQYYTLSGTTSTDCATTIAVGVNRRPQDPSGPERDSSR